MTKETIIETVGTLKRAKEVLDQYRFIEKKLGGKKKFRIEAHKHAKGYHIVMGE